METLTNLPEVLLTEILARLPMRSISRFKSVCKTWKTTLSSVYFRRRFLSVHQNSSPSWSLIDGHFITKELIGSYGCQTWNLPKSPYSYFPCNLRRSYLAHPCYSNGLVMLKVFDYGLFVGNPVLQKWVKIPKSPYESGMFSLVTRVDMDGVPLSFKIVELGMKRSSTCLQVHIYSSETGIWTSKLLRCHTTCSFALFPISLNGTLYLLPQTMFERIEPGGVLVAHDFYSETNQCQLIPLPNQYKNNKKYFTGYLTTSGGGFLIYIDTFPGNLYDTLKIWKLNNDSAWHVLWDIELSIFIGSFEPIAMHPFDSDIVYLMSSANGRLVSYNLRTQKCRILRDATFSDIDHQDSLTEYARLPVRDATVFLYQFVMPRWMDSIPCPPQTEIIDSTSLCSPTSSMHKRKRD